MGARKSIREHYHRLNEDYFNKFESVLDGSSTGPKWLADDRIAPIVEKSLKFLDGKRYDLLVRSLLIPGALRKSLARVMSEPRSTFVG